MFADEAVGLPGEDGVISETSQHGVTERQEKRLQQKQSGYNSIKMAFCGISDPGVNCLPSG